MSRSSAAGRSRSSRSGEQPVDPAECEQQRPPAGLGRVRRQDRRDPQALDEATDVVALTAPEASSAARPGAACRPRTDRRHGPGDRLPRVVVPTRPLAPARGPDAIALLGEIDEPEIEAERPDDDLGPFDIKPGERRGERPPLPGVVLAAEPDRGLPDLLDEVEEVAPGLLGDDLAEERAKQVDLERELIARPGGPDRSRLGTNGDVRIGRATLARTRPRTHAATVPSAPFRTTPCTPPQPSGARSFSTLVS